MGGLSNLLAKTPPQQKKNKIKNKCGDIGAKNKLSQIFLKFFFFCYSHTYSNTHILYVYMYKDQESTKNPKFGGVSMIL